MKILHVIPSLDARDGGPATAIRGMTGALADRGARITVATTVGRDEVVTTDARPGVTVEYFHRTVPGSWKYSRALGRWLARTAAGFDVVHVHALFSYATIPACRHASAHGVPLVIRPLGSLDPWSLAQGAWKKRPYLKFVERTHLDAASAIHVTSESERDSLRALGYSAKVRVIPLGVTVRRAGMESRESRARASDAGKLNVLFLSRLHPKKGLPLLIEALGMIRCDTDFTLRIAGRGTDAYEEKLRDMCASAGIGGNVTFAGQVEGHEKDELLEWADVFVLPSSQENFSLAAVEAMSAGMPVILSSEVGVARDAAEAGAGIVVPLNVQAVADALRRLARDAELRLRMGIAGRALVERRFTWDAAADALIRLYEELRAGRSSPLANESAP